MFIIKTRQAAFTLPKNNSFWQEPCYTSKV